MIQVDRLSRRFGSCHAIAEASFTVGRGEALGIAGAERSGKSTLLRMLAALVRPTSGSVQIDGRDVVADVAAVRRAVMYVEPAPRSTPMRVSEYLQFIAESRRLPSPRRAATEALRRVCVDPAASIDAPGPVGALAGVTAALMVAPPVILLDECLDGLEESAALPVLDWLRETRNAGTALAIASRSISTLECACDRVARLDSGRITDITAADRTRLQASAAGVEGRG
jgi:ABC-type multidrug transport system ATPase subunit